LGGFIPGRAAGINNVLVTVITTVGEISITQLLPNLFSKI
jgi:hypothetical protein